MNPTHQLDAYVAIPVPRVVEPARHTHTRPAVKVQAERVNSLSLCRETLAAFSAHSGPVLTCALVGFVGPALLARSIDLLTGSLADAGPWPYVSCAAWSLLASALARGALAWIGLEGAGGCAGSKLLLRTALGRWRELLTGSLIHTTLTLACALGATALFVVSGLAQPDGVPSLSDPDRLARVVAARSIDALLFAPPQPLAALATPVRRGVLQLVWQPGPPAPVELKWLAFRLSGPTAWLPVGKTGATRIDWLIALASLVLLVTAETLVCFQSAAAMRADRPPGPAQYGSFGPLIDSIRLGWRHFGRAAAGAWTLRLVLGAIQIGCIIVPVALVDNIVLPQLSALIDAQWVGLVCRLMCTVGSAIVSAILAAFCALYDARLFVALQPAEQGTEAPLVIAR